MLRNNNAPTHRLHVVPASYLLLKKDGKILLSRRANTGYKDGMYSLPAGHFDGSETAEEVVVREAKEEIGITVKTEDLEFIHVLHRVADEGGYERIDFFFACSKWQGEITNMEPHKCDDLSWFKPDELPDAVVPEVKQMLEKLNTSSYYSDLNFHSSN